METPGLFFLSIWCRACSIAAAIRSRVHPDPQGHGSYRKGTGDGVLKGGSGFHGQRSAAMSPSTPGSIRWGRIGDIYALDDADKAHQHRPFDRALPQRRAMALVHDQRPSRQAVPGPFRNRENPTLASAGARHEAGGSSGNERGSRRIRRAGRFQARRSSSKLGSVRNPTAGIGLKAIAFSMKRAGVGGCIHDGCVRGWLPITIRQCGGTPSAYRTRDSNRALAHGSFSPCVQAG